MPTLPLLVFGGSSVIVAILICFLPETQNSKLPNTILDAEDIGTAEKTI